MATAEAAQASLGPRYAPEDPTLPKPWKGLIDGSTGVLYYWNPETNVTQYEKPASLPPPLPVGQPPVASTPKLASIPLAQSMPPNSVVAQVGQQITQTPQQQGQQVSQLSQHQRQIGVQQQSSMVAQVSHHQGSQMSQSGPQLGQSMQHMGQTTLSHQQQFMQQMMQYPGQPIPQPQSQHIPQQSAQQVLQQTGQHLPQQILQQTPQQLGQQILPHQGSPMTQPQVPQFTHHQLQYMAYQQSVLPQGQHNSQHHAQHGAQGQPFAHQQEFKAAFPNREEVDIPNGNQIGFSPSQIQQTGTSSVQSLPAGSSSIQMPQIAVHPGQAQQYGGSLGNIQQPSSMGQLQQTRIDLVHQQHGARFQNQLGPTLLHGQQSNVPAVGSKMGYEDNFIGRAGNEYYFNAKKDGPPGPQDPKLAVIPMARNPQVDSILNLPFQELNLLRGD